MCRLTLPLLHCGVHIDTQEAVKWSQCTDENCPQLLECLYPIKIENTPQLAERPYHIKLKKISSRCGDCPVHLRMKQWVILNEYEDAAKKIKTQQKIIIPEECEAAAAVRGIVTGIEKIKLKHAEELKAYTERIQHCYPKIFKKWERYRLYLALRQYRAVQLSALITGLQAATGREGERDIRLAEALRRKEAADLQGSDVTFFEKHVEELKEWMETLKGEEPGLDIFLASMLQWDSDEKYVDTAARMSEWAFKGTMSRNG
ncbi:hypothetical protein B0T17DRAFT_544256 [Bombardia bombarda]|uniref:Uncharacterized protein n=1 Tax=Bombardia bombarda TaxID=252184 RepID=A0AA39WAU4_9PEZI|nr:hypothetical protein B0T17DRAFT_544256 [Bombardia bombarda]